MPPLAQRLFVTEPSKSAPLSARYSKRFLRPRFTPKLFGEGIANFIEMHEFIIGIVYRGLVALKQ